MCLAEQTLALCETLEGELRPKVNLILFLKVQRHDIKVLLLASEVCINAGYVEPWRQVVLFADDLLHPRVVQKVLRLPVCVDLAFFRSFMARLVVAIKCSSLLLSEGHEDDGSLGNDRVDDQSRQHDDEHG